MNLCVIDEYNCLTEKHQQLRKGNKWALKLIGVMNSDVSYEDFLEFISLYVNPNSIQAFFYDSFNNFYSLFLSDVESFCHLVGKKESMGSYTIRFLPLLDFYVIDNVYPYITNDDLCRTFESFGSVFQVTNYHVLPNSSKFSHVLSGKREISFTLPGEKSELNIPINVFQSPYRYHVRKLCSACLTEGHSVLRCPDIEEEKSECDEDDSSSSELSCILKTEVISGLHNSSNDSLEAIKDEVTDVDSGPENINSKAVLPLLERAVVPIEIAVVENGMPSLEPSSESRELYDSSKLVKDDNSENSYEYRHLENTQEIVTSKDSSSSQNGYLRKNMSEESLHISDTIDLESEDTADELQNGYQINSPKNTHEAVPSSNGSSYFREVVHRRQIKETLYTYNTVMSNETEDSVESDEGLLSSIKRRKLNATRTSQAADISATEKIGHFNDLSPAAQGTTKHRKVLQKLPPEAMEFIDSSVGALSSEALKDVILCDGRKPNAIVDLILQYTSDFNAVDEQLKQLYRMYKLSKLSSSIKFQHILSKIMKIRHLVLGFE